MWKLIREFVSETKLEIKVLMALSIAFSFIVAFSEIVFAHAATKFVLEFVKGGFEFVSFDQYGFSYSIKITHYITLAIVFKTVAEFLRYFIVSSIGGVCLQHYKQVVFSVALQTKFKFLWRTRNKAHYFTSVVTEVTGFAGNLSQTACCGIIIVFLYGTIVFKFPKVGGVIFVASILLALSVFSLRNLMRRASEKYFLSQNLLTKTFNTSIRNYIYLKIMGGQDRAIENLNTISSNSTSIRYKLTFIQSMMFTIPSLFLLGVLFILSSEKSSILTGIQGDSLLAVFYLLFRLAQQANTLISSYASALKSAPDVKEMQILLRTLRDFEVNSDDSDLPQVAHMAFPPKIEIRNLTFSYDGVTPIYDNYSLSVAKGEYLGISGRSGIGKSTFLNLVLGVEEVNSGEITIDGLEPDKFIQLNPGKIAYVGPEPFFIDGTIKENLLYGTGFDSISEEELLSALAIVGLDKELSNPTILGQQINDNDLRLSSGQMQRLCIARALAMKPKLLILDEFTANLDKTNEKRILEEISNFKGAMTVFIVAHDDSVLAIADNILNLELLLDQKKLHRAS